VTSQADAAENQDSVVPAEDSVCEDTGLESEPLIPT